MASETKESYDRFRYIGFDVYPGKPKEFWETEEERRKYEQAVKSKDLGERLERDSSIIHMKLITRTDRIVLGLFAALSVLTLVLPWWGFTHGSEVVRYIGLGILLNLPTALGLASWSGTLGIAFVLIVAALVILTPVTGVLSLLKLFGKRDDEEAYMQGVKSALRVYSLVALLWLATAICALAGIASPLGNLGTAEITNAVFSLSTFFASASISMYIALAAGWVGTVMANML